MAELFGGVAAVTAMREVLAGFGERGAAVVRRNVEEPVVEVAFGRRREFPVGAYAGGPELTMCTFRPIAV
ncbi:hypothetical protein [Streptomyces sp. NPDC006334]|uniref:hypothetical protein n=1 Tax=Streptomyces sp. NPDC006334 TaxID=3156754 RepID=UPI0033B90A63